MRISLSVAIMFAPWSGRDLSRLCMEVPGAAIIEADRELGHLSVRDAARRAWEARDPRATHHLVIQDDAIPCVGFLARVLEAIAERPSDAIALFTDRANPTETRWFTDPHHLSGLANVLPATDVATWLAWCPQEEGVHDDGLLWRWLYLQGRFISILSPSLVEHAPYPSLLGHPHRRAHAFIDQEDAHALLSQ